LARKRKFHPLVDATLSTLARCATAPVSVAGFATATRCAAALADVVSKVDRKHMVRAQRNLRDAYPTWSQHRVDETAHGCFRHMFQLGAEFIHTPRLITRDSAIQQITFTNMRDSVRALLSDRPVLLISGHIGNWELVGYAIAMLGFDMAAVYRPLDLRGIDAWVREGREAKGLHLLDKFGAARSVPACIAQGLPIGLVADQSGGDRGYFTPFFGRLTSTYKIVALTAMQYGATIVCGNARRLRPDEADPPGVWQGTHAEPARAAKTLARIDIANTMRYAVEIHDVFGPKDWEGNPDAPYYISARFRRALESMVRSAPEQYFWMHRIWRSRPAHERMGKPFPEALEAKLRNLPWLSSTDVDGLIACSNTDAANLHVLQKM
jgi:KDO2-lipid IV(A) lauroyltransferase